MERATWMMLSRFREALNHTCALKTDNTLHCWGRGDDGRLGYGVGETLEHKTRPVEVVAATLEDLFPPPIPSFSEKLSTGYGHTCHTTTSNEVRCWGYGTSGQLGDGMRFSSDRAVNVKTGSNLDSAQLSNGGYHSCSLSSVGDVKCWGHGNFGQLGHGLYENETIPVSVKDDSDSTLTGISQISSGKLHTCALNTDSEVLCWGYGDSGRLGSGATDNTNTATNVKSIDGQSNLTGISQVSAGGSHTCAIQSADGSVLCWGSQESKRLGNGQSSGSSSLPVQVPSLSDVAQISVGGRHTCALTNSYRVYCWGQYKGGSNSFDPTLISFSNSNFLALQISAGENHTCALRALSSTTWRAYCWGEGGDYQLGLSSRNDFAYPRSVRPPVGESTSDWSSGLVQVSAGDKYTCVLRTDDRVFCWGKGDSGRLGLGYAAASTSRPERVPLSTALTRSWGEVTDFRGRVSAGGDHSCAITEGKDVYCWGHESDGRLGNNLSGDNNILTPTPVTGTSGSGKFSGVDQVAAGGKHSCAVKNGGVFCWGDHTNGQVGNGSAAGGNKVYPRRVKTTGNSNLTQARRISAGAEHTCTLRRDGDVACWGNNAAGQLGVGDTSSNNGAVTVLSGEDEGTNLGGIVHINAGKNHSCAVKSDGRVLCWGNGAHGRLGNNGSANQSSPVFVKDTAGTGHLQGIVQVSAGQEHTCALAYNGSVYCWGKASNALTGNHNADRLIPRLAKQSSTNNLSGIEKLIAGEGFGCALRTYGQQAYCWGKRAQGRIGEGNTTGSKVYPTSVKNIGGSGSLNSIIDMDTYNAHVLCLEKGPEYCLLGTQREGSLR